MLSCIVLDASRTGIAEPPGPRAESSTAPIEKVTATRNDDAMFGLAAAPEIASAVPSESSWSR